MFLVRVVCYKIVLVGGGEIEKCVCISCGGCWGGLRLGVFEEFAICV